jgi:hypothetical protein
LYEININTVYSFYKLSKQFIVITKLSITHISGICHFISLDY